MLMRRVFLCLVLAGVGVVGCCSGSALGVPVVTLKVKPVPIAGFKGTGNCLGCGAAVEAEYKISGTEYGGFAPPLIGVNFYSPAGVKLSEAGFALCAPATLEAKGPGGCPKSSAASPIGEARGVVSFGSERVEETATLQGFFAPGGGLAFYVAGSSPVALEFVSKGHFTNAAKPFGPEFVAEVPIVETVPGALDASVLSFKVKVGAAVKKGKKVHSYITLPKKCPKGGFPVKSELLYQGGIISDTSYTVPCPKK
jgi:hypothetical protein